MPGVNGHVVSFPALHASRSMLSLAPEARMFGWFASIATAGSFCLFCENGLGGLPMVTRVSGLKAAAGSAVDSTNNAVEKRRRGVRLTIAMLLSSGGSARAAGDSTNESTHTRIRQSSARRRRTSLLDGYRRDVWDRREGGEWRGAY